MRNKYPLVRQDTDEPTEEERKTIPKLVSLIKLKHIKEGHNQALVPGQACREAFPHTMDILTIDVCKGFAGKIRSLLHDGKRAARSGFTRNFGYIFWEWKYKPTLRVWSDDRDAARRIPVCKLSEIEDAPNAELSTTALDDIYADFRRKHREMAYIIRHDVDVYATKRTTIPPERKVITFSINLIDVAARWCRQIIGFAETHELLASNKNSLRMVYAHAVFFRAVLEDFTSRSDFQNGTFPSGKDIVVSGIGVGELTGLKSSLERAMGWDNTKLLKKDYRQWNMTLPE